MKIDAERLKHLLHCIGYVVRSNRPVPDRQTIIEAIIVSEVISLAPMPPANANLSAWYTMHLRDFAITLVNTINEDYPLDMEKTLDLIESAYRGLHQQLTSPNFASVGTLLLGTLTPSLPPTHLKLFADWLVSEHYTSADTFVSPIV